jgi:predicted NUDIX family NTP pyrophosphohydrolase
MPHIVCCGICYVLCVQLAGVQDDMISLRREKDDLATAYHAESERLAVAQARLEDVSDSLERRSAEMQRLVEANRRLQLQMGEAQYRVQEEGRGGGGREDTLRRQREMDEEFMR